MTGAHANPDPSIMDLSVRVYYEDTDAGGIVYYANYLRFMERARTEWLRAHDISQQRLKEDGKGLFVVRDLAIQYRQPAVLDDVLIVRTTVQTVRKASLIFHQEVRRAGELLCDAVVTVCYVDSATRRPLPLSASLQTAFKPARN